MPFESRSLPHASRILTDHLNALLVHTITRKPLILFITDQDPSANLSFRDRGRSSTARLRTRFGPMELFLGHVCDAVVTSVQTYRLRTVSYTYHLTPFGSAEPLLRWEYVRNPLDSDARWCRHHLQGPIALDMGRGRSEQMNNMHLPTGWVPIEEILRFCIVDLGVPPLADDWDRRLRDSVRVSSTLFAAEDDG